MQFLYSQIIPTEIQKKQIKEITTPERLIEYSKGLSNEARQSVVIDSLINEIKKRDLDIVEALKKHREDLVQISILNSIVNNIDTEINEINEDFKKGFFEDRFHLYGSLEVPQFEFNSTILSGEFMIDLDVIEFGAVLNSFPTDNKLEFNYGVKARYKFF